MTERFYCSRAQPEEAMMGTSVIVDVWLLLEYRGAFGPEIVVANALSPDVKIWLEESVAQLTSAGFKSRVQFIRQPESDHAGVTFIVAFDNQTQVVNTENYQQLLAVNVLDVVTGKSTLKKMMVAQYFVCTNGQRDLCCAKFGLPVYMQLRQRHRERVWQTSHVGGHRYAPNVLVLPQGMLYGRVHPEVIDQFCEKIEAAEIAFEQLRGRSCYPKHVQAAEAFVGLNNLRLSQDIATKQGYRVQFSGPEQGDSKSIEVAQGPEFEVKTSCSGAPKMARLWLQTTFDRDRSSH